MNRSGQTPGQLFGHLLVQQGLVTEEQLARAIERQRGTQQRLGDILADWNLITQQHVQDVLRRQRRLRMTAAFLGALFAPLQSLAAQAAPVASAATLHVLDKRELDDMALDDVAGQGLQEELVRQMRQQMRDKGVDVRGDIVRLIDPVLSMFESDLSLRDVTYDPARAVTRIDNDGSLTLALPTTIGEISFRNIRIHGAGGTGPSFGSITLRGIDLTGTTVTLALRP